MSSVLPETLEIQMAKQEQRVNRIREAKELEREWYLLRISKWKLTRQQYLTLKGQLKKGDIDAFRKGLFTILKRRYN